MGFEHEDYCKYIDESIFHKKLNSGLDVYVLAKKHFAKKYAFFGTHYGGMNNVFEVDGLGRVEMPQGIAHFLEHQIFEDELESTFEKFEKIGASVNAYTSNGSTVYHIETVDEFDQALKLLMNFVLDAQITDRSVEKEKEVIIQEIKMYEDEPEWLMGTNLMTGMYHNHPVKDDIAGTVESVRSTTKEQLLKCYEYFYNPSNMAVFVFGDVDPDHIFDLVESNQTDAFIQRKTTPKFIMPNEPYGIVRPKTIITKSIAKDSLIVGFKANPDIKKEDRELKLAALRVASDMMFGKSSNAFSRAYEKGWITDSYDMDVQLGDGYAYSVFGNQTDHVDLLHEEIFKTVEWHLNNGFEHEDFLRMKRKLLGRFVASFNSLQSIASNYTFKKMRGFDLFEQVEAFNKLSYDDIQSSVKNFYNLSNSSMSAMIKDKK